MGQKGLGEVRGKAYQSSLIRPLAQGLKVKVTQLCPSLCDPMDYIVHGILQARILE